MLFRPFPEKLKELKDGVELWTWFALAIGEASAFAIGTVRGHILGVAVAVIVLVVWLAYQLVSARQRAIDDAITVLQNGDRTQPDVEAVTAKLTTYRRD